MTEPSARTPSAEMKTAGVAFLALAGGLVALIFFPLALLALHHDDGPEECYPEDPCPSEAWYADQIAALTAADVLLRGAHPPDAAPDELLRAARAGMDTLRDELLRPEGEAKT